MEEVAPLGQSILYVLILQIGYASGVFNLTHIAAKTTIFHHFS